VRTRRLPIELPDTGSRRPCAHITPYLAKQDERLREGLKAQEARVNEMIRAMQAPGAAGQPGAGQPPPPPPPAQAGAQQARA